MLWMRDSSDISAMQVCCASENSLRGIVDDEALLDACAVLSIFMAVIVEVGSPPPAKWDVAGDGIRTPALVFASV